MAPLDYLPESVSTPTFLKRLAPNGVYDRLGDAFSDMGTAAVANADVDSTFFEYTPNELQPDCHFYRDCQSVEYTGNLFGEVLGQAHGTFIGARGNHYPGPNAGRPNQITDQTKARCSIVIGCPSFAPGRLKDIWHNQLCTFVGLRRSELKMPNCQVKEIVKPIVPERGVDAITLTGGLMYTCPRRYRPLGESEASGSSTAVTAYKKRPLSGQEPCPTPPESTTHETTWPTGDEIHVGAEYDYRLMPDSGGRLFSLKKAKLVQPDWRDISGALITPWSNHASLRPGTVIVANISIRTFTIRAKGTRKPERKIYQALINHLQVVAESDVHVSVPEPLHLQTGESPKFAVSGRDLGGAAFNELKATFASRVSAIDTSYSVNPDEDTYKKSKRSKTARVDDDTTINPLS
ncbi:hypothetical protein F5879DRAFT_995514 [Lentinula edodes]|nr:hypothetical protein F5879DRAFT_995514 [Lentinula edodes]